MKYVINDYSGIETPIIFPDWVSHDTYGNFNTISAGFVRFNSPTDIVTFGKSTSLGKQSRNEDANIIKRALAFEM